MKPYISIEWNDIVTGAKGWLVIHNFVKGYAGGGIRMHPQVTHKEVVRLAECMAYKYKACGSTLCGGCKGGIAYDSKASDAKEVLRRYLIAMMPYIKTGVSLGGDLGTRYSDILKVFLEFGFEIPMTKSMLADTQIEKNIQAYNNLIGIEVEGILVNDMIAGYGIASSADEAWEMLAKDHVHAEVIIQGMGRVGFATAKRLTQLGHKIIGISDSKAFIHCSDGLDIELLYKLKKENQVLPTNLMPSNYKVLPTEKWLSVKCDILIPAALDNVIHKDNANEVKASLIVEGANIPTSSEADEILKKKNIYLICDFTANLLEAWFYDVVFFGIIEPKLDVILYEGEALCRRNAKKQMISAINHGIYAREAAQKLFAPTDQDLPEV